MPFKKKTCPVLLIALAVVLCGVTENMGADYDELYNRPYPIMDYVPQELGMYDATDDTLTETECRACHGDSLMYRHHYSETALEGGLGNCDACHTIIQDPPGVTLVRDCLTSGCHSPEDATVNGWHHDTDLSGSENCVGCHGGHVVNEITPFSGFDQYPPSVVTPTPFNCENCHWEQEVVPSAPDFDPDTSPVADAGHPSTYDHTTWWGETVGYYAYEKVIAPNKETHHMGPPSGINNHCFKCHGTDPDNDPSWDPYDPELIRYCETCHDTASLATIPAHGYDNACGMGGNDLNGWEAIGFNTDRPEVTTPDIYRPFTAGEQCLGCHGDSVPCGGYSDCAPYIKNAPQGINPNAASPGNVIELYGGCFGDAYTTECAVQLKKTQWANLPGYAVLDWTNERIQFSVPYPLEGVGNYAIRVKTAGGMTNYVGLTIKEGPYLNLYPDAAPCGTVATVRTYSGSFGSARDTISAPGAGDGVYWIIDLVSSQGTFTFLNIKGWKDDRIRLKISDFFQDTEPRNYLQDPGEPAIEGCGNLELATFSLYIRYISYSDDDSTGTFTDGDTILYVGTDTPLYFELTDAPLISKIKTDGPLRSRNTFRIVGSNFGDTESSVEIYMGNKNQYNPTSCVGKECFGGTPVGGKLQPRIRKFSDGKIKVKAKFNETKWAGKKRYIWVVRDGVVSNAKKVSIAEP